MYANSVGERVVAGEESSSESRRIQRNMERMQKKLCRCIGFNKGVIGCSKVKERIVKVLVKAYGRSLRKHNGNARSLKIAIWAPFYHFSSTDSEPRHNLCPNGCDSWCGYKRALATGTIHSYRHDPRKVLPVRVLNVVKSVYEEITQDREINRFLRISGDGTNGGEDDAQLSELLQVMAIDKKPNGEEIDKLAELLNSVSLDFYLF